MDKYKAIDFFCGGGGMTCGLKQAGIDVIAGIDNDINVKSTYETNHPESIFVYADIKYLTTSVLNNKINVIKDDNKLILVGCSPCPFYSNLRIDKSKHTKTKDLLMEFARFVDYYNPAYVVIENVPGIVTNKYSILPTFKHFLTCLKYKIKDKVVDLSYYGVPQSRKRYILIATRLDKELDLPVMDKEQSLLQDYIGEHNGFQKIYAGYKDNTEFKHSVINITPKVMTRIGVRRNREFSSYERMVWNKPAPTITSKFFNVSCGRYVHPDEDRAISVREGATLQTFPKDYKFPLSNISTVAKIIGNAVPPEYARRIGLTIRD
jgi:DNA (cytosine-5)-methyltransferase 1